MPEPKQHDEQTAARNKNGTPPAADTSGGSATSAPTDTDPRYEPYPGADFFHGGRHSPLFTAMAARLQQEGCTDGRPLGPDWTTAHRDAFAAWQHKLRPKDGGDTSGIPDQTAWDKLRVPRVTPLPPQESSS